VRDSSSTISVVVFRRFLLLPEASLFNTPDPAIPQKRVSKGSKIGSNRGNAIGTVIRVTRQGLRDEDDAIRTTR
jgi:hypothetical protein